jgi:1,4-dihydroxy-6-naphthoate synthase
MARHTLRIGQSADPDDAFMAWGLEAALAAHDLEAEMVFDDIQSLNLAAQRGDLDLTAISVAAYADLATEWRLLRCGASFGDAYGPVVVARAGAGENAIGATTGAAGAAALSGLRIAIPGTHTSARLLLRIYGGDTYREVQMPFDRIMGAVLAGDVDAGLIIHEGQLIFEEQGFRAVFEPAAEWARVEQLPVPLGAVAVRRDLPEDVQRAAADAFLRGIHAGFDNMELALDFAGEYARGLERAVLEEYVLRYVNAATLDMGERGIRAIARLFELAEKRGLIADAPELDVL